MKPRIGVLLALTCLLALGATAQVTREEFDAMQTELRGLKAQVTMLDIRVKKLEAPPASAVAAIVSPAVQAVPAKPLTGLDLDGWKLARSAAYAKYDRLDSAIREGTLTRDGVTWTRDGLPLLTYDFDEGKPTTAYMEKTPTGDYVFSFATREHHPMGRPGAVDLAYRVHITKYGDGELRVETIDVAQDEQAKRYWAALAAKP